MKKFRLYNRDGYKVTLEFIKEDEAIFKFESSCRVSKLNENSYQMVDPAGGPFIMVGQSITVEGVKKKVTSITMEENDLIIRFNENTIG